MKEFYDEMKKYYEYWWENPRDPRDFIFKKLNELFIKRLPTSENKKALDVGSGKGTIISYLLSKSYQVTGVELNENFVRELRNRFPGVEIIEGDFNLISLNNNYDLVTAIEFIQNLDRKSLEKFFNKVSNLTNFLIISVSNRNSLHGFWVNFRKFKNPFVYMYTPKEIEEILKSVGFEIHFKKGVGLLTPITVFRNFKLKLIPIWVCKIINFLGDNLFPNFCHLVYIEAKKKGISQ